MRENGIKFDLYIQKTVTPEELRPFCSLIRDQWPLNSQQIFCLKIQFSELFIKVVMLSWIPCQIIELSDT